MSQVSKRILEKEVFDRMNSLLVDIVAFANDTILSGMLIDDLLTPTEKIMIAKRLSIIYLLREGYSYLDISEILKVSTNTVTTVRRFYKANTSSINTIFDKIKRNEDIKETLKRIAEEAIKIVGRGHRVKNYALDNQIEFDRKRRKKPY